MRLVILLIGLIAFVCSPPQESIYKKLQGHWHRADSLSPTLDIIDSVVMVNKYSMLDWHWELPLFDSARKNIILPEFDGHGIIPTVDKFYFKDDTLVYDASFLDCMFSGCKQLKLVKGDFSKCKWAHALPQDDLILAKFPMQTHNLVNVDSLLGSYTLATMLVGLPVARYQIKEPRIIANEVFLSFEDIPVFINRTRDETRHRQVSVLLVIDKSIPKAFADSVINAIPKSNSINLLRLVKMKASDELGLERIN